MSAIRAVSLPMQSGDSHRWTLLARIPDHAHRAVLWLPALGVAARHYLPLADALAARGVAVFVHEWRGHGSSSLRASRAQDWGYVDLLLADLPASQAAIAESFPALPLTLGGHSLGAQLAACRLAIAPSSASALWLVAGGAPYFRAFPAPQRYVLPLAYRFLPWLARIRGALPGRAIGFGGTEARGVIGDWARSALSGRYAARGVSDDLQAGLAAITTPVRAVVMADDWLAPASSVAFLLSLMPRAEATQVGLDAPALGVPADHFSWMAAPDAVVDALCGAR